MVRPSSFDSNGMKKGAWSEEEDNKLRAFVERFGHPNWRLLPSLAGLARSGKSCRLRWLNYLKPGLKRGNFTKDEHDLIIKLHRQLGNKWSAIAAKLPGRTDNEIKNYWHGHIEKRCSKRNGHVARVIKARTPQQELSSNIKYCVTTDSEKESASANVPFLQSLTTANPQDIHALNLVANTYSVAQVQGGLSTEPYQTYFSQLNIDLLPFIEEQLHDPVLCHNDMSTFYNFSSDGGITSWNSSIAEFQGNFWFESFEADTFNMIFGDVMNMLYD